MSNSLPKRWWQDKLIKKHGHMNSRNRRHDPPLRKRGVHKLPEASEIPRLSQWPHTQSSAATAERPRNEQRTHNLQERKHELAARRGTAGVYLKHAPLCLGRWVFFTLWEENQSESRAGAVRVTETTNICLSCSSCDYFSILKQGVLTKVLIWVCFSFMQFCSSGPAVNWPKEKRERSSQTIRAVNSCCVISIQRFKNLRSQHEIILIDLLLIILKLLPIAQMENWIIEIDVDYEVTQLTDELLQLYIP